MYPTKGGNVAHALAKLGCESDSGTDLSMDSIPDCIMNLVADDSAARSG